MDYVGQPVHDDPAASLFCHVLVLVFGVHVFLWEIAIIVLESFVIHGKQFTENLAFHLLNEVIDGIPINEMPLFSIMCMKIKIKR